LTFNHRSELPHSERRNNSNDRRRGKTAILTSTHKKELEESVSKRSIKKPKLNFNDKEKSVQSEKLDSIDKQIATKKTTAIRTKTVKKTYKNDSGSSSEESESVTTQKNVSEKKYKRERKTRINQDSSSDEENEEATYIFCTELYSESKMEDSMIMCAHCKGWAHEACAGVEPDDDEIFICDFCQ
jgi:hypothetical protein